jgi:hypothetical protein
MFKTQIVCQWCGEAIGLRHDELFRHVSCTRLPAKEPINGGNGHTTAGAVPANVAAL